MKKTKPSKFFGTPKKNSKWKNSLSKEDKAWLAENSKTKKSKLSKFKPRKLKPKKPKRKVAPSTLKKSLVSDYQRAVSKTKSPQSLTYKYVKAIKVYAGSIGGDDAISKVESLFDELIESAQKHHKKTLHAIKSQEILRRIRLVENQITGAQVASHGSQKNIHLQETLFNNILSHPEEYYTETQDACMERVNNIQNVIDELDEEVRKFAEFNLQFFLTLASEERSFKPIKLPDDANYFRWPDTDVINKARNAEALNIDAEDAGVLSILGYNVQLNGPTDAERRRVLDGLFNGNIQMPRSLPEQYVVQWGDTRSVTRLRKMACSIASFARQHKRKRNASVQAIGKWQNDLAYLRRQYYEPFSSHFDWPAT